MPQLYRSPLALPFPLTLQKQLGCWAPSPAVSACEPVQSAAAPATLLQPPFHPRSKPSCPSWTQSRHPSLPVLCQPTTPQTDVAAAHPTLPPASNRGSPLWLQPQATVSGLQSPQPPERHPRLQSHLVHPRLTGNLTGPCGRTWKNYIL